MMIGGHNCIVVYSLVCKAAVFLKSFLDALITFPIESCRTWQLWDWALDNSEGGSFASFGYAISI